MSETLNEDYPQVSPLGLYDISYLAWREIFLLKRKKFYGRAAIASTNLRKEKFALLLSPIFPQ